MNNTTDLTLEGIRAHMRRQFGEETDSTQFSRKSTFIGTLTKGQWEVIEKALAPPERPPSAP